MVKSKLALIIDSIIISFTLSSISFLWLRKFLKNANLVYFFSILINLLCFILFLFLFYKSNNKKLFKNSNEKFIKDSLKFLLVCDTKTYNEFLSKLTNSKPLEKYFFKANENFLYINLKTELTSNDFFEAQELFLKNKSDENAKLFFIFNSKNKSFDELILLSNLNPVLLSSETIVKLMKQKNFYPITAETKPKKTLKQKVNLLIKSKTKGVTKSHFKEIFFSGLSLLFISFVIPFSNYYLVIGSILLLVSIVSLFRKDTVQENNNTDFLFKD